MGFTLLLWASNLNEIYEIGIDEERKVASESDSVCQSLVCILG